MFKIRTAEVVELDVGRHLVEIRRWNWREITALVNLHGFCVVGDSEELLPVKGHADFWMALAQVAEEWELEAYTCPEAPWVIEVRPIEAPL